jgi:hypothetical protein
VQPAIQQEPLSADGTVTFVIRVLANQVGVSAYQGVVTFSPGAFELVDVHAPAGLGSESHLLNSEGFDQGRVRFAAFTPTSFAGTNIGDGVEALRLTVRPLRPVEDSNLIATLDVVSGETGAPVAATNVLASPGIQNAPGTSR